VLLKLAVLLVLGRIFRMGLDQNLLFGFALAQGGEFAFVLFSFATQHRVIPGEVASPLVAAVALSMALTPLLMLFNERVLLPRVGTKERPDREPDEVHGEGAIIIAGYGRFGNIVGRLLAANEIKATVLDIDSDHVDILRKIGFRVFYGDASREQMLRAAGAAEAKVLVVAVDDPEKALSIVHLARKHFPQLTVLARACTRPHAYDLLDAGVDHVYRETLDSSLRVGADALRLLGVRSFQAHRAARVFRRHDERHLRELCAMRHDKKSYFSHVRQRIQDLEDLLQSDLGRRDASLDSAWDAASRRSEFAKKAGLSAE
jgi:voltage-gated potassium channel Kch